MQLTEAERQCETYYKVTRRRDVHGRYMVRLPFSITENLPRLGSSFYCEMKRLENTEKRFKTNTALATEYCNFMDEYKTLGHMVEIPPRQLNLQGDHYYLPHHAVQKLDSTTTRLRVVFDGSCRSSNGKSLNEVLLPGPCVQEDLMTILLRFRIHRIGISADIEKMFRQIIIREEDRDYLRILWRDDPTQPVQHYRLTNELANEYIDQYPIAANILDHQFYVDDMLTGCDDIQDAIQIYNGITSLLKKGGFNLRKWKTNRTELMNVVPTEYESCMMSQLNLDESTSVKTLGEAIDDIKIFTKRTILSEFSKIFDPFGWLSPTTTYIRILFQKLWLNQLDWDDELNAEIRKEWVNIRNNLHELVKVQIPRYIKSMDVLSMELHVFADASELAYGAVLFLCCIDRQDTITVRMIGAKSRVAPIKQISLPRLELCAASVAARWIKKCRSILQLANISEYAWSDSKVVLGVGNRTSEIIEAVSPKNWFHVPSKQNPADLISRGVPPNNLIDNDLWWRGPIWLYEHNSQWPKPKPIDSSTMNMEERTNFHTEIEQHICDKLFNRISSLTKIYRILCYTKRIAYLWGKKFKNDNNSQTIAAPITVDEFSWAETLCIKWAQFTTFSRELLALKKKTGVFQNSGLKQLTPFVDNLGVMRVGGRLNNSQCNFDAKHPIIIPKDHPFSRYVIRYYHETYLHAGPTMLIGILRQRFWIIRGRKMVRSLILECVTCYKQRARANQQLMGELPSCRVTPGRVFACTGVDYAGPIWLRERLGRGPPKITKGYIAIFICMSVKAVHIELVSSMTTEPYIAALRRFIGRRGLPHKLLSDNGSNFVGARNELNELYQLFKTEHHYNLITTFLNPEKISYKFNPAGAPNFGGLWEANVKSVKHHLRRVIGSMPLTFEEMSTLLIQVESLLNSRPLITLSEDPSCFDMLTPGHFLIGVPITALPEPSACQAESLVSRWQNVNKRVESFWSSWSSDYLTMLNTRKRWVTKPANLKVGQLVLVRDSGLPKRHGYVLGKCILERII